MFRFEGPGTLPVEGFRHVTRPWSPLLAMVTLSLSGCDIAAINGANTPAFTKGRAVGKQSQVAAVNVTPETAVLNAIGASVQLTATVLDAQGSVISGASVTWAALDAGVAIVDATGRVEARGSGTGRIAATSGGIADTATVEVRQVIASVSIAPSPTTVALGESVLLSAAAADSNGFAVSGATFSWTSSDPAVVTVNGSGAVLARGLGVAVVGAETDHVRGTASVNVLTASAAAGCESYTHDRLVSVSTSNELRSALRGAKPGDQIRLRDGVYTGRLSITASGTADKPIALCGTRNAVIDGGSVSEEKAAIYHTASHWTMVGFTIRNAKRAILAERASHNVFRELEIFDIGQEAIHIRVFSSHNTVERSKIYNTGLIAAEWGEGIYIGSWNGHWCTLTGCEPDRSDYNLILDNVLGPNVAAEHIDIKEGTTGGVVRGNRFDGIGMVPSQDWIDSWVLVQGNGYTIADNAGAGSLRHGFKTEVMLDGWGNGNTFTGNIADVRAAGFGFRIANGSSGNVVSCGNVVRNAKAGFATVPCH